jgi:hypothetical protein
MLQSKLLRALSGVSLLMMLVSCGGGGDIAGDSTDFVISPKTVTIEVDADADGSCTNAIGALTTFTIIGGQAPFRIVNAAPDGLSIDKTEATGKDPKFTVTPAGGCGDPFTITVLDYHSKVATVEVTITAKEVAAAAE